MQFANLSPPAGKISVLLVADQPRSDLMTVPEPNRAGKLTGKPPTRNSSTAQPGRSQPRRRKAFLPLARSQRMEALPKQAGIVVNHRGGIVVKLVIVRQRGEGAEPVFMLVSQIIQLRQSNDRRRRHSRASNPEWEIGDSGFELAVPSRCSSAARPTKGTL
jgi:hypothetical protein